MRNYMKKINTDGQLTVKEFLQLEDGYYNLENPIEYAIDGSKGELSGVITVHTDVKVLSGLMKIVTTCANDVSYYIDNVWQDGEVLEVSAKDEGSGSGGGGGGSYSFVKILDNYNGTFPAGNVTCPYGEPTKISVAMAAMKDIVDGGGKILGFTLDASIPAMFLSNVCVRKGGSDEYISFIAHQDDANIYDVSTYNTILFFMFNAPGPASESDVNFTASVYAICAD